MTDITKRPELVTEDGKPVSTVQLRSGIIPGIIPTRSRFEDLDKDIEDLKKELNEVDKEYDERMKLTNEKINWFIILMLVPSIIMNMAIIFILFWILNHG